MSGIREIYQPKGSIVPIITPVEDRGGKMQPDQGSINRLAEHIIVGGSDAIFGLGTSGEFREQTESQKMATIDSLLRGIDGRVPLLIGVSAPTIKETVRLTKYAEEVGAVTAVVLAPMYGDGQPGEKLKAVKEATTMPIVLYNNPGIHNGLFIPIDFIEQVRTDPQVAGIKDSSQDDDYISSVLQLQTPTFSVLVGQTSHMLFSLRRGAEGVVNWLANPFPDEVKEVYNRRGDSQSMQVAMDELLRLGGDLDSIVKIKNKLTTLGIIASPNLF